MTLFKEKWISLAQCELCRSQCSMERVLRSEGRFDLCLRFRTRNKSSFKTAGSGLKMRYKRCERK